MNKVPNSDWINLWVYDHLKDEDGEEVKGGKFFTYHGEALWRCVNQLGVLHNDLNTNDDNLDIVDRILDALYNGDWISQMQAISNMERIDCFNPMYVKYVRWIASDDCTYGSWIVGREEYWEESGFNTVRQYAKYALWRLDNYDVIPQAVQTDEERELAMLRTFGDTERREPEHVFEYVFNIDDWRVDSTGLIGKYTPKAKSLPPPPLPSSPKLPPPIPPPTAKPALVLPHPMAVVVENKPNPKQEEVVIVKKSKKEVTKKRETKKVQQRLF